eukprot:jgi/Botrbrau1/14068/Bobra.182_3s0015.1
MRKSGFESPIGGHQIVVVSIFIILLSTYYILCSPLIPDEFLRGWAYAGYGCLSFAALLLASIATWLDPTDYEGSSGSPRDDDAYCTTCQKRVRGDSKHCRHCDRCCAGFDHHCVWLNNCVGSRNYNYFLASLVAALAQASLHVATCIYLLVATWKKSSAMRFWMPFHLRGAVPLIWYRLVWIFLASGVGALVGTLAHLLVFHICIICRGMSTYEYILAERARKGLNQHKGQEQAQASSLWSWNLATPRTAKVVPHDILAPAEGTGDQRANV